MSSLASSLFAVVDLMLVDNENRAQITEKRGETSSLQFVVKHFIGNIFERNVLQNRCKVINILHEASTRSVIVRSTTPHPSVPLQTTVQTPNTIR